MTNIFDSVLIVESIFAPGEAFILNADGSASFGAGGLRIDTNGNILIHNGAALGWNGSDYYVNADLLRDGGGAPIVGLDIGGANIQFNYDGSASFVNGQIQLVGGAAAAASTSLALGSDGSIAAADSIAWTINYDGTAQFAGGSIVFNSGGAASFVNGALVIDDFGDITTTSGQISLDSGAISFANNTGGAAYIDSDGSASFLSGAVTFSSGGIYLGDAISLNYGFVTIGDAGSGNYGYGTFYGRILAGGGTVSIGNTDGAAAWINNDGTASFANGGITLGNRNGVGWINYDGSAGFADNAVTIDSSGSLYWGAYNSSVTINSSGINFADVGEISSDYVGLAMGGGGSWLDGGQISTDGTGILTVNNQLQTSVLTVFEGGSFANGSLQIDGAGNLWLNNSYTEGAPSPTGYLIVYDNTGTPYKIPALAA